MPETAFLPRNVTKFIFFRALSENRGFSPNSRQVSRRVSRHASAEAADLHRRHEERALHRPGAPFSRSAHHVAGGRGERQLELGEQPELKRFELKWFECRLGRLHGCQLLEQHGLAVRLLEHAAMHFPDEIDTGHETVRGEEAFLIMLKRHA